MQGNILACVDSFVPLDDLVFQGYSESSIMRWFARELLVLVEESSRGTADCSAGSLASSEGRELEMDLQEVANAGFVVAFTEQLVQAQIQVASDDPAEFLAAVVESHLAPQMPHSLLQCVTVKPLFAPREGGYLDWDFKKDGPLVSF